MGKQPVEIITDGAVDKMIGGVERLGTGFLHAVMLSEIKKGDLFYEFRGRPGLPRRKAAKDAEILEMDDGEKIWAVKLEKDPV